MSEEQFRELKRKCVPVMVVTLTMEIYIIIYENKEECVVSKLENKNGKVTRRLEENKKIKKENLEIYYCNDIYETCNCLTL